MPCKIDPPEITEVEWLEHMLCKACQYLTVEQIESITAWNMYKNLREWYIFHLETDTAYFHLKFPKINYHLTNVMEVDQNQKAKKEMIRIESELNRFDLELIKSKESISTKYRWEK